MNETIRRFGHPATLLRDYEHWVVLLRPAQVTLGSLVVAAKSEVTAFADLPAAAFAELATVAAEVEGALRQAVDYAKVNWLMLMMADPNVHFHVLPRYEGAREHDGLALSDAGWPKVPDLAGATTLDEAQQATLVAWLKGYFPA